VHPDACDDVRAKLAALAAGGAPDTPAFDVRAEIGCAPGTCRIETELGTVDASLDAQLARLSRAWSITESEVAA
jgi:flagellar biosynthesis/type III secretory pathway protein FliH